MKKLKGILSIFMVLALLCSTVAFATTAQAADTAKSNTGLETKLQDKVEDGVILHALCWGYSSIEQNIPAIAAAGYSAVQVSPVQQPKDMNTSTNVSGQWWKMYQPVSLSLAKDSWVGTPAQLKSLCTTAHKYGVKIICDVVTNHLGATSDKTYESQPWLKLADEVKTFEPTLWNNSGMVSNNPYFHNPSNGQATDGNANAVTQTVSSKCPDLNTGNSTVQNRVISLLKECIDAGADGFRFDAAKHIETPSDSGISPNNYWTNVINGANAYAQGKGKSLFYYGEVLNTAGNGRSISGYTNLNSGKYRITDNVASNSVRNSITGKNASGAANPSFSFSGGASHAVVWAESHDTYLNTESGNSTGVSDSDILKTWAMVASRKDATPLFFARTNSMKMGESAVNTTYKSIAATEINKFHNNFVGQSEKSGTSGNFAYVARGTSGVVIVNVNGTTANASVSGTGLANGEYKDMITGNKFTVSGGTVSGNIGSTGIAVVVQSDTTPMAFADQETQTFKGDTITVGLSLSNATSGTYQLEDYTPVSFTGSPKIKIGSDYNKGDTIKLTLTATDGKNTTSTVYYYTKSKATGSGVYIIVPASAVTQARWTAPLYCYLFDQDSGNGLTVGGQVYKNAAWPGEELEYDSKLDAYYLEVSNNSCMSEKTTKVTNGQVTGSAEPVASTFNLANSAKTHVIVSDSAKSSGGVSQGNQFPGSTSRKTLDLGGVSHKLTSLSNGTWVTTTEVPGQSSSSESATTVTKGNSSVQPTTTPVPTTTAAQQEGTTVAPVGGALYGDVDGDNRITVKDATTIQKHVAKLETIPDNRQPLADVIADNNINIKDATAIQKYVAKLTDANSRAGQPYGGGEVVTPTQAPQTPTQAPQTPTQATEPQNPEPNPETYTLYIKTQLSWISSQGCEPYVYDNATGESYLMSKDFEAYPEVFCADVPKSVTDVSFYRALAPATPDTGYNAISGISVSPTNNCIVLTEAGKEGLETTLGFEVEPYVAEEKPTDCVTTIYVENNVGWPAVYIHGWGKGIDGQVDMENVSGNIWKYDLPEPIYGDTGDFFLFKGTPAGVWEDSKKTADMKITDNNNFYNLGTGQWSKYTG